MEDLYKVENLSFTYPGETRPALEQVSFSIQAGAFVLVCGASGSGKSTLLRCLKNQDPAAGFVGQNPETQLICDTVYDELAFGIEQTGTEKGLLGEISGYFGLDRLLDRKTDSLSGGEKQMVNLAAVTALKPNTIILDEPAVSLDPIARNSFYTMVTRLNREQGITVILCEHDCQDILGLSDQIILLEKGRCLSSGFDVSLIDCPLVRLGRLLNAEMIPLRMPALRTLVRKNSSCLRTVTAPPILQGDTVQELKNVYFKYDKNAPYILKGLGLRVRKGALLGIAGGNGSGKTTLLKVMTGIYKPFSGKCAGVKGRYLSQDPHKAFLLDLVGEDFADYMKRREILPSELEKFPEYYELYKLYRHKNIYDISGGELQRLAIYKLLLGGADLLLLDEPTKGLDEDCKQLLGRVLQDLARRGVAVVLSTHDMEFIGAYCTEAAFLFDGKLTPPGSAKAFLGDNEFYTTVTVRALREQPHLKGAVCPEDLYREEAQISEASD